MSSIADQTPYNEYTGNGVATAYGFEFEIIVATQLKVKVDGELVSSADYTVSGVGVQAGGTVTFDTAPADQAEILIYRDTALERTIGYTSNGPFPAPTVNKDFNYLWMVLQEILSGGLRVASRVLRFPFGDDRNAELPSASARANKALIFDAEGDVAVSTDDYEDQVANVAASAAAAAASAAAAAASEGIVQAIADEYGDLGAAIAAAEGAADNANDDAAQVASDRRRAERARDTLEAEVPYVELLDGRTDGLSIDITHEDPDLEVKVLDSGTPANDFNGTLADFMALSSIAFVTPKLCVQEDVTLKYQDHNDALQSEDFSNASWTKTNMSAVTGATGPDGTTADACTLTTTGTASSSASQNVAVLANWHRTHEFYVKKGTGAFAYIAVTNNAVTRRAYFNLTTGAFATVDAGLTTRVSTTHPDGTALAAGWYCIAAYHKAVGTTDTMRLGICDADNNVAVTSGVTMLATRAQHTRGVKRLGYVKTTTATKRGIPYDYTHGVRAVRFDVSTNYRGRYADDQSNAAWTKTNITAVLDATGPHGEPCSTLTATADNGTSIQAVTSAGTAQNFHAWVRRKTGTGTLSMTMDNGGSWTDVTADVGEAGGDYQLVYLQGALANPTVGFRVGTSGDEFEVALANTSATTHVPPPVPSQAIDFAASIDVFSIPTTAFPTGAAMTAYSDVYIDESAIGGAGARSRVGFFGAGTVKSTADLNVRTTSIRLEHTWDDGATSVDENWGDSDAGRIQIQQRYKSGDCAMAANGNAAWWNAIPGSYTFTSFAFTIAQSTWLRRLVVVPEDIDDDTDDLRLFKLDDTAPNVNSNLLAAAYVAKCVHDSTGILRIPAMAKLYERGDVAGIACFWGQRYTSGYNLEAPQRMMMRRFEFDRSTNELTALEDVQTVYEPPLWTDGATGAGTQGYTALKIAVGPYRGRLVLLHMEQATAGGSPDARSLYMRYSDDNGDTWSSSVKIVDKSVFVGASAGFAATGENGTMFQLEDGPHAGRVYFSLNGNNTNHYACWSDEFKEGATPTVAGQPGMDAAAWTKSTTPVTSTSGGIGTLSEPALVFYPDTSTLVMFLRNTGGGIMGYAVSTDYGVTFGTAQEINGDTTSHNVNCGAIQDDPTGKLGLRGRLIVARSTLGGRIGHKIQSTKTADMNFAEADNYRLYSPERFVGYCPLLKLFENDTIHACMAEHQPTVTSNVNTSQMLAVFRY